MQKYTHFEIIVYFWFFDFFENPDMADVQSAIKHAKIVENSKFKKQNSKHLILELPFAIGFI